MELSETAQLLYSKYGTLTLDTKQLSEVLHYKLCYKKDKRGAPRSLLNAISAERCPVYTFKVGKARVADIRDVAEYLDSCRHRLVAVRSERKAHSR